MRNLIREVDSSYIFIVTLFILALALAMSELTKKLGLESLSLILIFIAGGATLTLLGAPIVYMISGKEMAQMNPKIKLFFSLGALIFITIFVFLSQGMLGFVWIFFAVLSAYRFISDYKASKE